MRLLSRCSCFRVIAILFYALNAVIGMPAAAQCSDQWQYGPDQGVRGIDGTVYAAIEWPLATAEGIRPVLIAGGTFAWAGHRAVQNLAYWDGEWRAFGIGTAGPFAAIRALCIYRGELIAAGKFTSIDGTPANSIARWDGLSWHPLGAGIDDIVYSLCVLEDTLYVSGTFSSAGGSAANNIASWNGEEWSALGDGLSIHNTVTPEIRALVEYEGKLFAAGTFTRSGASVISSYASWDGSAWKQELSPGAVHVLRVYKDRLYAGIDSAGGTSPGIRMWNGSAWVNPGGGVFQTAGSPAVYALAEYEGRLAVAGTFTQAGSLVTASVALWDGAQWSALGQGVPVSTGSFRALTTYGTSLVGGGIFAPGAPAVRSVAEWNGEAWVALGSGLHLASVSAISHWKDNLVLTGSFSGPGTDVGRNIALRQGGQWLNLGGLGRPEGGPRGLCLSEFEGNLIVGGRITNAGGVQIANVGAWNGHSWAALGSGLSGQVNALTPYGNELIAGGFFTAVNGLDSHYIARWNGEEWLPLGKGASNVVFALTVYQGDLIVGGQFAAIDGVSAQSIARWNGSAWFPLGSGLGQTGPTAFSLTVHQGSLIVGGRFSRAGGLAAANIARWDGSTWSALGSGLSPGDVYALASHHGVLYATGAFAGTGGAPISRIARWNGAAWLPMGAGINSNGFSLHSFHDELFVGGDLTRANNAASIAWARWGSCSWCAEDLTGDGYVNDDDFTHFVVAYGLGDCGLGAAPTGCPSDFNNDGTVDDADFCLFVVAYNEMLCS